LSPRNRMFPTRSKFCRADLADVNFPCALLGLLSALLAIAALLNDSWIVITDDDFSSYSIVDNSTSSSTSTTLLPLPQLYSMLQTEICSSIGTRTFWRSARFGGYSNSHGHHVVFQSDSRVLVDCVNDTVANLFYGLIAVTFVIVMTSSMASLLALLAPSAGFLQWLRRNTVLEVCSMILSVIAAIICLVAESQVATLRPETSQVGLGSGLFLVLLSGVSALFAASVSLRRTMRRQKARRLDNQRLLCARSLRSWRDAHRRPSDSRPIVDFEGYLEEQTILQPVLQPVSIMIPSSSSSSLPDNNPAPDPAPSIS